MLEIKLIEENKILYVSEGNYKKIVKILEQIDKNKVEIFLNILDYYSYGKTLANLELSELKQILEIICNDSNTESYIFELKKLITDALKGRYNLYIIGD